MSLQKKIRIGILISGMGSNMEALIRAMRKKDALGEITLVASDNQNAQGLKTAAQLGIPVFPYVSDSKIFNIKSFEKEILHAFGANNISLICLAGFMRILSPQFLKLFPGKILNIHPSILPSLKGLDTHRRAIEKNLQVHGATVHEVTEKLDSGRILGQTTIRIQKDDTAETLCARLKLKEHQLYTDTLSHFILGKSDVLQRVD